MRVSCLCLSMYPISAARGERYFLPAVFPSLGHFVLVKWKSSDWRKNIYFLPAVLLLVDLFLTDTSDWVETSQVDRWRHPGGRELPLYTIDTAQRGGERRPMDVRRDETKKGRRVVMIGRR